MQPAAPRDHHRHREVAHGRTGRHRVAVPPDPVVPADDQDRGIRPTGFQGRGHPGLDVQVALAGRPGGQRFFQRRGGIGTERAQVLLLGHGQGEPQRGEVVGGVCAERRVPVGGQCARGCAGDVLGRVHERIRVVPGHGHQFGETVLAGLVLLGDPVRLHLGGDQRGGLTRYDRPDQIRGGRPVHWRRQPAGQPGHRPRPGQHQPRQPPSCQPRQHALPRRPRP